MSAFEPRILLVAGAGALLSLDRRAAVQAMFAHPVVAAAIVGLLLKDLTVGLAVGVTLGLLWSGSIPVGGVVPPDETLGAVVGTGVAVLGGRAAGASLEAAVALGFGCGVPAALLGRRVELALRRLNGEWAEKVEKSVMAGDLGAVDRAIFRALAAALAAAAGAHLVLLALAVPLARLVVHRFPHADAILSAAAYPLPLAGLGGVIPGAGFRIGLAWATLGFVIGLVVAEVLR